MCASIVAKAVSCDIGTSFIEQEQEQGQRAAVAKKGRCPVVQIGSNARPCPYECDASTTPVT